VFDRYAREALTKISNVIMFLVYWIPSVKTTSRPQTGNTYRGSQQIHTLYSENNLQTI
jgi:hypothetical protein